MSATAKKDRMDFLRKHQAVLDANPPDNIRAYVSLEMGSAMVIGFTPFLDRQAIPWYIRLIEEGNDVANHRAVMVAKIHLGNLLHRTYRRQYDRDIERLYREVLDVPPDKIMFDYPDFQELNPDAIENAINPAVGRIEAGFAGTPGGKAFVDRLHADYRQQLMHRRMEQVEQVRSAASRQLMLNKVEPGLTEVTRARLEALGRERPDDATFQGVLRKMLSIAGELSTGRRESPWSWEDERIRGF